MVLAFQRCSYGCSNGCFSSSSSSLTAQQQQQNCMQNLKADPIRPSGAAGAGCSQLILARAKLQASG